MSEITPASSPGKSPALATNVSKATNTSNKTATGVDLAPVVIKPSRFLWRIELVFYLGLLSAATIALIPFFLTAFYWSLLWLVFAAAIACVVYQGWRATQLPALKLRIQQQIWHLEHSAGDCIVIPFDEILLWSFVIILPVRETLSGRKHRIVILQDSMVEDEWRRLRVWLRTGLR